MGNRTDYSLIGQTISHLTVLEYAGKTKDGRLTTWKCQCDCGNIVIVNRSALVRARNKSLNISCGCHKYDHVTTHHMSNSRLYGIYNGMYDRCYRETSHAYKHYGQRGIRICDEWLKDFEAFSAWAFENGYEENLTIDRIDVDGNYEPANCRWTDSKVQCNNKRNNRRIALNDDWKTMQQWGELFSVPLSSFQYRVNENSDYKDILSYGKEHGYEYPFVIKDTVFEEGKYLSFSKEEVEKITFKDNPAETGRKYGRLTIIKDLGMMVKEGNKQRKHYVQCVCECGNVGIYSLNKLRSGHTSSCGCLRKETTKQNKNKQHQGTD